MPAPSDWLAQVMQQLAQRQGQMPAQAAPQAAGGNLSEVLRRLLNLPATGAFAPPMPQQRPPMPPQAHGGNRPPMPSQAQNTMHQPATAMPTWPGQGQATGRPEAPPWSAPKPPATVPPAPSAEPSQMGWPDRKRRPEEF